MDELAARAGEDPVAYRLSILSEPRARAVIERVAERAGWPRAGRPAAARASVSASPATRTAPPMPPWSPTSRCRRPCRSIACGAVVDAGLVINPDGALNQLEGGIVQAVSWTLKEEVRLDEQGITSRDWDSYPILRFSEVPEMQVELVDDAGNPSLGVGECTVGPDRRGDRQRRRPCARRAHPRPAPDPRPHHGGAAQGVE